MRAFRVFLLIVAGVATVAFQGDFGGVHDGTDNAARKHLDITPVYQQTPVWCWAAVGEMVFAYYGVANINPVGNFQCGIVALLHPVCDMNCLNCPVPAGSLATMNAMLTRYPTFASQVSGRGTQISTIVTERPLTLTEVRAEIEADRPIVAGISPSGYRTFGVSEHVALIIGYDGDDLIVNDPFPFVPSEFLGNPYLAAGGRGLMTGQYRISYDRFVTRLQWRETIYGFRCSGPGCLVGGGDGPDAPPEILYGRSCQTTVGTCGPFFDQPALPLGSPCYCATPYGPVSGRVVRP